MSSGVVAENTKSRAFNLFVLVVVVDWASSMQMRGGRGEASGPVLCEMVVTFPLSHPINYRA